MLSFNKILKKAAEYIEQKQIFSTNTLISNYIRIKNKLFASLKIMKQESWFCIRHPLEQEKH